MELVNNSYAFYMLGRGSPQTHPYRFTQHIAVVGDDSDSEVGV